MIPVQRLIQRNYTATRKGYTIKRVVLHTYGGKGTSLYNWFNRIPVPPDKGSSAHYAVMKDGKVEQYVKDTDIAWHAGTTHSTAKPNNNYESIGIEHQDDGNSNDPTRTPELYESASQLVAMLCKKYSIPCVLLARDNAWGRGIALHNFYTTAKPCPAGLDHNRIIKRANEILNNVTTQPPTAKPEDQAVWDWANLYRKDVVKVFTIETVVKGWWYPYSPVEVTAMYHALAQQVEHLSKDLSVANAKLVSQGVELTEAQKKNEEYLENIEALEDSLESLKIEKDKEIEELKSQVAREENKNKLLKEQNEALTIANNNQGVLIEEYEIKIENQRVAIVRLEKKLEGCETSMTTAIETLIKKISDFIINLFKRK